MKKTVAPTRNIISKKIQALPIEQKKTASKQPVKTLEIFISNLDQHIADSYAKLRKSKHSHITLNSTVKKQNLSQQSTQRKQLFGSQRKQPVRSGQYGEAELDETLKNELGDSGTFGIQHGLQEKQNPTLISNQQVTKYINFVYETYNIPDPLAQNKKQKKLTIVRQGERKNSITTISLRKKSSLSSLKQKIVMQKNIDLTPMKTMEIHTNLSNINTTHNSVNDEFDSSKYSNTFRSAGNSSRKYESNKHDNSKKFTETDLQNQTEVQQIFRYCFACEAHVLQRNLKFHEQLCKPLQEAYLKPYEQLLAMLNEKINRLTTQVQTGIVQAQPQKILSQFNHLKQTVSQWVGELSAVGNKQNTKGIHNSQIRSKYSSIQHHLNSNLNCHLQSLSRLSWFIRLRQNLLQKINSQL